MPVYSKKEFREICGGLSAAYLSMNIKRGKVVCDGNGNIDSSLPMNKDFMDQRQEDAAAKQSEENVVEQPEKKEEKQKAPPRKPLPASVPGPTGEAAEATSKYNLEKQQKELEIEKKEQEIELNKIKIAKAKGDVIPTDLVKVVFAQHSKSVTTAFHQGADNFIGVIAKQTGMKRDDMAKLRGDLIDIVNEAVKDSLKESKEAIKNIVNEYSEKRGRGEKK